MYFVFGFSGPLRTRQTVFRCKFGSTDRSGDDSSAATSLPSHLLLPGQESPSLS